MSDRKLVPLDSVSSAPLRWLWKGRIPLGGITLLDGDPGDGKSTVMYDLAARVTVDYAAKRRILEIICLNFSLDGVTRVPTMRRPFDMLAEGLDLKNSREFRGPVELFLASFAEWEGDVIALLHHE